MGHAELELSCRCSRCARWLFCACIFVHACQARFPSSCTRICCPYMQNISVYLSFYSINFQSSLRWVLNPAIKFLIGKVSGLSLKWYLFTNCQMFRNYYIPEPQKKIVRPNSICLVLLQMSYFVKGGREVFVYWTLCTGSAFNWIWSLKHLKLNPLSSILSPLRGSCSSGSQNQVLLRPVHWDRYQPSTTT